MLLVLGRHYAPLTLDGVAPAIATVALRWGQVGWIGVDLFFGLSGFLVSGLLFTEYRRHGRVEAGRFLVRRGFKIYPAFWMLLLVSYLVQRSSGPIGPMW